MTTVDIVLGIVLLVLSVFLIVAVLMQHGKTHNLSGTIAGGAETFFGKTKGQTIDKKLSTVTTIIAIIFVAVVIAFFLKQDTTDTSGKNPDANIADGTTTVTTTAGSEVVTGSEAETTEVTVAVSESETVTVSVAPETTVA